MEQELKILLILEWSDTLLSIGRATPEILFSFLQMFYYFITNLNQRYCNKKSQTKTIQFINIVDNLRLCYFFPLAYYETMTW